MNGAVRVEGEWPSPITLTRGWARAVARPWNDDAPDAFIRLERGRAEFLQTATAHVASISGSGVFSPAMFGGATRVWVRAGFEEASRLVVMERPLSVEIDPPDRVVDVPADPPWQGVVDVDRRAFTGFWRMSLQGLREALAATSPSALMTVANDNEILGFAIVGSQWGTAYLQRVAVDPAHAGKGVGTDLVRAAIRWAARTPSGSMVLNVRSANDRATRLYERSGFSATGRSLRILRSGHTRLLDGDEEGV